LTIFMVHLSLASLRCR